MNIQQINSELPITDFLTSQGIQPTHRKGCDWWYISPIRAAERTPSFKVNTRLNRWYDHGTGEGGKIFDLALCLYRTASIREVIQLLSEQFLPSMATNVNVIHLSKSSVPRESPMVEQECSTGIKVLDTKPLEDESQLANYLQQRSISLKSAKLYCQEVRFSIGTRQYEAVGFENQSGGYELRNSWFKGSSSPKDFTFIDNGASKVCLLEGFMDFLSLLQLRPHLKHTSNFLVLNSLAQLGKSLDVLGQHRQVLLFLDNDAAGRMASEQLLQSELNCRDLLPHLPRLQGCERAVGSKAAAGETASARTWSLERGREEGPLGAGSKFVFLSYKNLSTALGLPRCSRWSQQGIYQAYQ